MPVLRTRAVIMGFLVVKAESAVYTYVYEPDFRSEELHESGKLNIHHVC